MPRNVLYWCCGTAISGGAVPYYKAEAPSSHSTTPYTTAASVPYTMTGPAMRNILAPVPGTRPSALNSMAALTTALAKPVMGTSDPAPAFAASFWYQPSVVSTAESKIKVQLVRVPAVSASAPCRRNSCRSPSPSRQIPC